ncbi:MAG: Asd/ArgC dimerization domain-containing protein [Terriglobales bacterium]|jgi:aspartate-semialdehyde dehydrogenase
MIPPSLRVAIVGSTTFKGKELADVLRERKFPARDIRLLDDEALGKLESLGDEVTFVQKVGAEQLQNVDVVFLASEEKVSRQQWTTIQPSGAAVIDLSYGLETESGARLRAPWIDRELGRLFMPELQPAPVVVAHPAAVVLALVLLRAQKAGRVRMAAATVIEPASERGRSGMDELHEQTVSLLSFHQLPKQIFDAQVAFNLISRYGTNAQPPLETVERRIAAHYAAITGGEAPTPALMLLQGPSFHSHAFSIFLEMESAVSLEGMGAALQGEHLEVVPETESEDAPSPVSAAGKDDLQVSVRQDRERPQAFWLWVAADNLRTAAINAVECAGNMIPALPTGTVQ